MKDKKQKVDSMKFDSKEFELPETVYICGIENRVFQGIVVQCLSTIHGISLIEGGFINHILGREEGSAGIHAEQDPKQHAVSLKIKVYIEYGVCIPEKAEEIQSKVVSDVTRLTGLRVSEIHVVFDFKHSALADSSQKQTNHHLLAETHPTEPRRLNPMEYSDVF